MQRYVLIDVLRGVAALMVLVYHVFEIGQWTSVPVHGVGRLIRVGWMGVDLFFVISGFVIGKAAIEASLGPDAQWRRNFAERRLRRIVPLYLLTTALYLLLVSPDVLLHGWKLATFHVGSHLLFLHNLHPSTYGSINGPTWSVALEMQFYVLAVLAAPWMARTAWWKFLLTWAGIAIAWRFGTTQVFPPGVAPVHVQITAATQLPGVLDQFALGIAVAKLAIDGHMRPGWRQSALWGFAAFVVFALAWAIFWRDPLYWYSWHMITFWRTLVSVAFAAAIAAVITCPGTGGLWMRPFRYLGEISYGLYLWHVPVLLTLLDKTPWRGSKLLAGVLLGTVLLATLSWYGFEKLWMKTSRRSATS